MPQIGLSNFVRAKFFVRCLGSLFLLVMVTSASQGQRSRSSIIDDSTKLIYGPHTSRYITEAELFYNEAGYQRIDTTILNIHRWHYLARHLYTFQDLGNVGTALRPVLGGIRGTPGVNTGFTAYDPYYEQEVIKIYNTRSPYSSMAVVWGGNGRAATRAEFSRNITPRWNFGFNYRAILVDKQIQRKGKGDRHVIGNYYDLYTHYQDKGDHYSALLSFRRMRHKVNEYGGVYTQEADPPFESYFSPNAQPTLTAANSEDWRINIHLFHQYKLARGLQLYHKVDQDKQRNLFSDDLTQEENDTFFDFTQTVQEDSLKTDDKTKFTFFRNEFGIKGGTRHFFYNGFYKLRAYAVDYKYLNADTLSFPTEGLESSLGGSLRVQLDSLNFLTADLEVLSTGQFRAAANLRSKWFEAEAVQSVSKPSFLAQAYRGHHDQWHNRFNNEDVTSLAALAKHDSKMLSVRLGARYRDQGNYVYFVKGTFPGTAQTVMPVQSGGRQRLLSPEGSVRVVFLGNFTLRASLTLNQLLQNDDDALEVPAWMVNTQFYYHGFLWKRNLEVNIGTETHLQPGYYAYGYDPVVQQFYRQSDSLVAGYPIVDAYLDGKIKWARFFVRYHNVLQLFRSTGYLATPGYPAMRNVLDFGFDFAFYD
jgi:hypothetical protein